MKPHPLHIGDVPQLHPVLYWGCHWQQSDCDLSCDKVWEYDQQCSYEGLNWIHLKGCG